MLPPCASHTAWPLRQHQREAPRGLATLDLAVFRRRATPGPWEAASRRMRLGRHFMNQVLPAWPLQLNK